MTANTLLHPQLDLHDCHSLVTPQAGSVIAATHRYTPSWICHGCHHSVIHPKLIHGCHSPLHLSWICHCHSLATPQADLS
ncbi:hypothetical protein Hamer_G026322 [Homarus americanus]|uniref:Uncharacterized protein n=1 Tax=Homarus americanus TaxID=6706 RepID=A0A8J5JCF0_HOMAM|nr:hypothetical protein Hamer_G026322 [Homarus americanus]